MSGSGARRGGVRAPGSCGWAESSPTDISRVRAGYPVVCGFESFVLLIVAGRRRLTTTTVVSPHLNLTVTGELGPGVRVLRVPTGDAVVRNSYWISPIYPHAFIPHWSLLP